MNNATSSQLMSIGSYLPETRVKTSEMLEEIKCRKFGVDLDYIEKSIGVSEVRHSEQGKLPSELAIPAARAAIEKCKGTVDPNNIDLIIFCGIEGDYVEPSTAHVIQAALGLKSNICFDVQNACLGFMTALQIANSMIASGAVRYALVCTGELSSKVTKASIKELRASSCKQLFSRKIGMLSVGDAGGAAIVGPSQTKYDGFLNFGTESKGQYSKLCYYRQGENGLIEGQMIMGKVCSVALNSHKHVYKHTLCATGWSPGDIDCLITHQIGARPFSILSTAFGVPESKMIRTYNRLGNVTSASFPVSMTIAEEEGKIKSGSNIWAAMAGSGISVCHVGFTLQ